MIEIKKYFEKIVDISEKDWELFSSKLIRREFLKKSVILKMGEKENYLSFIEKGIVRKCIPQEFDDLTFEFGFANNFVTAYEYFLTQEPSTYQIETITDTVLWSMSFNDLQTIYTETNIGNTIGRLASEDLFIKKAKRELSLLTQSAENRYLNLFTEQPHILQLIPLKYIASYIGITPQALSRVRKRIS
jgi:CRP-like cAMP-binding protein